MQFESPKLTEYGTIDVAYYQRLGEQARAEAIRAFFAGIARRLRNPAPSRLAAWPLRLAH